MCTELPAGGQILGVVDRNDPNAMQRGGPEAPRPRGQRVATDPASSASVGASRGSEATCFKLALTS
jgi:hypothetical protein